jgi:hypothetical protein
VVACGKLLARDEIGRALSHVYEEMLGLKPAGTEREAEREDVLPTEQPQMSADVDLISLRDSGPEGRRKTDISAELMQDRVLKAQNEPEIERNEPQIGWEPGA